MIANALMRLTEDDLRTLGSWAADCAERVLPLFEAKTALDRRPREAIDGAREFGRGGKRTAKMRTLAWAAYAAARECGDPSATAAARAAGHAVGSAYLHPLATADQAKHILGSGVYAALARELAAGDGSREIGWAIEHAPPDVRALLRQMPARAAGRTPLDALYYQLDAGLRR